MKILTTIIPYNLNNLDCSNKNRNINKNTSALKSFDSSNLSKDTTRQVFYRPIFLGMTAQNKTSYWDDFLSEFKSSYPDTELNDVIIKSFENNKNFIGEGRDKIVFNIPLLENYVGGYLKRVPETDCNKPFVPSNYIKSEYYFGEPIAENGKFIIMKKIEGQEYSISKWAERYIDLQFKNSKITQEEAKVFLKTIEEIAQFPMKSYINLQKQVRYLTDNNIRVDSINPNNIIVNKETQKINLIDISQPSSGIPELGPAINCSQDAANLLVDAFLNTKYLSALSEKDAEN